MQAEKDKVLAEKAAGGLAAAIAPPDRAEAESHMLAFIADLRAALNPGRSWSNPHWWMSVGFVQDRIRLNSQLTADAGLRYDRQTLTTAKDNFAPRLGIAWNPGGDSRSSPFAATAGMSPRPLS